MAKIKKDDTVLVIAGKDRGTTGKVISVDGNRVTVDALTARSVTQRNQLVNAA